MGRQAEVNPVPFLLAGLPWIGLFLAFAYSRHFRGAVMMFIGIPILMAVRRHWPLIREELRNVPSMVVSFRQALRGWSWREVREEIADPTLDRARPPFVGGGMGMGGLYIVALFFILCEPYEDPDDSWQYFFNGDSMIIHLALNLLASTGIVRRAFEGNPIRRYRTRVIAVAIHLVVYAWLLAVSIADNSPLWRPTHYWWAKWVAFWWIISAVTSPEDVAVGLVAKYFVGWQVAVLVYGAYTLYTLQFEKCTTCGKRKRRETMMRCKVCKLVIYCDKRCEKANRDKHPRPCTNHEGILPPLDEREVVNPFF